MVALSIFLNAWAGELPPIKATPAIAARLKNSLLSIPIQSSVLVLCFFVQDKVKNYKYEHGQNGYRIYIAMM
jgi:hypothetical protein